MKNLKFKRLAKYLFFSIAGLMAIGTVTEQIIQLYFNSKRPPETAFVEINGKQIHFVKKGSGGPTVVFQSGLGGDFKIWEEIQNELSGKVTTISYDRVGLQWSDAQTEPKTLSSISKELEMLLEKTNCPKPYMLVGHSLAGITLRPFVRDHIQDVAGVVFLDVSHPLQIKKSSDELKKYLVVPPSWLVTMFVETGLARLVYGLKPFMAELPGNHWMNMHVRDYFYKSYVTLLREAAEDDAMFEETEKIASFGSVPLRIVTGAYPNGAGFLGDATLQKEYLQIHRELQKELLQLSSNSMQIIAPNSGHYVPLQDPKIVVKTISDLF